MATILELFPGSGFDQIPASGLMSSSVDKSLLWCFRRWSLRFPFCVDLCLQRRHGKGFADTWIRKWISRRLPAWNSLQQTFQQFTAEFRSFLCHPVIRPRDDLDNMASIWWISYYCQSILYSQKIGIFFCQGIFFVNFFKKNFIRYI